jgi:hypothetical protein
MCCFSLLKYYFKKNNISYTPVLLVVGLVYRETYSTFPDMLFLNQL